MLSRIVGAFLFRKSVYEEVEKDKSFTTTAWIIVVAVAFLNQLGSYASGNYSSWLIGTVVGTILAVIGFAVAALIISWVGKVLFGARTDFGEMVRCLGLAYVWSIVSVIGVVAAFSPSLASLLPLLLFIAQILALAASLVAIKAALDLDWIRTIVTVIVGWLVKFVIEVFVGGTLLGMLELTAGALSLG